MSFYNNLEPRQQKYIKAVYLEKGEVEHYFSQTIDNENAKLKKEESFEHSMPLVFKCDLVNPYKVVRMPLLGSFTTDSEYRTIVTDDDFKIERDNIVVIDNESYRIEDFAIEQTQRQKSVLALGIRATNTTTYMNLVKVEL